MPHAHVHTRVYSFCHALWKIEAKTRILSTWVCLSLYHKNIPNMSTHKLNGKKKRKKKHSFNYDNKRIHVSSYEEKIDAKINRNKQGFFLGGGLVGSHSFINATCTNVHFLTLFLFKWFFLKRPSRIFSYHCMEHLDLKGERKEQR